MTNNDKLNEAIRACQVFEGEGHDVTIQGHRQSDLAWTEIRPETLYKVTLSGQTILDLLKVARRFE